MFISVIFLNYEGVFCYRINFFLVFVCIEIIIYNFKLYFFLKFVFSLYGVVVLKICIIFLGCFFFKLENDV